MIELIINLNYFEMNRLIIYYLLILVTITACQQDNNFEEAIERDITIEEVQAVFKEKQSKNIQSRTTNNPMDIVWDRAVYKELNVGDGLFFPVNTNTAGEGKLFMSMPNSDKKYLADYASYSMAYKNEDGEVVLEHVIPVSTADTERFTGFLLVSEWQGDAKRKVYYQNGEITDVAALSKQYIDKEDIDGQRMNTCYIVDDWWCVTATTSAGNSYTTCTYEGSYIYCEEPQELAPPAPDPSGGGGGGSSDPSGPGGLCEHPFIEGMYVDCNEVICSEGYVADENGNCVPELPCMGSPCCDENGNLIVECEEDRPCDDLPLKNMSITNSGASGKNGGRFGCTRNGEHPSCPPGKKKHDGLDISASIGTYVFSSGYAEVVDLRDEFGWGDYKRDSYGNFVILKYTGGPLGTHYVRYNHLDFLNVGVGDILGPGMIIGRTGTTGNASAAGVTPHVHFQVYNSSWESVDPEDYLNIEYDENGIITNNPC